MPKICATMPIVGGTVDNHKKPKVIPKMISRYQDIFIGHSDHTSDIFRNIPSS